MFWEEMRFPIRHRLHRYEAKYSQHTIQNDKTLGAIGQAPSESKCLLRKIYAALAEAEGIMTEVEIRMTQPSSQLHHPHPSEQKNLPGCPGEH